MSTFIRDYIVYTISGSDVFIGFLGYTSPPVNWDLVIPNSVTDPNTLIEYNVVYLAEYAFINCSNLRNITLLSNITTINNSAFQSCTSLISADFSNATSLAYMGPQTFQNCPSITTLHLSPALLEIFYAPRSIITVTISPNASLNIINQDAFGTCEFLTSIEIPSNVTTIANRAFYSCASLTSVKIDNQAIITSLGTQLFNAYGDSPTKTVTFYLTPDYSYLTPNGQIIASYFSANPSTETITILYDSQASCFNENTKILCLNKNCEEEYIIIQNLKKGDLVKSYLHGYRKIELIGKGKIMNQPNICWYKTMFLLEKTDQNELIEDLIVTGGHALLVDQLSEKELETYKQMMVFGDGNPIKIDNKFLLLAGVSSLFKQITEQKIFTFYHLSLENNGDDNERFGIWANGILTETVSKKQFNEFNYELI